MSYRILAKGFAATLFMLLIGQVGAAHALGMVSRACSFNAIPTQLKAPALTFFALLGMPERLKELPTKPLEVQQRYWVLESLTTDYGSLRYYLFAENEVYEWWWVSGTNNAGLYRTYNFRSPWAAQSLPPEVFTDSRLTIFNFNRKVLFSARAGHPEILTFQSTVDQDLPGIARENLFYVMGKHYYYDPVTKAVAFLGTTTASDCNLSQWGFQDR